MTEVKIVKRSVPEIMDIVGELRVQGLGQGVHFDFAYIPAKYDDITGHFVEDRYTLFTFYEDRYATLFTLKWST